MCAQIVDLRKTEGAEGVASDKTEEKAALPVKSPREEVLPKKEAKPAVSAQPPESEKPLFTWSADERPKITQKKNWFLIPGSVTLLLAVLGIFIASYFFTAFVALAFVVFVMYATREPRRMDFALYSRGLLINQKLYEFSEMKSFWVFDRPQFKELSFETSKVLYPYLRVPLEGVDPEKIKKILQDFLPEKEHPEFITDHISRRIGI